MAAKQPQGKRRPSASAGVSRSYSQMYKNATTAGAPAAPLTPATPAASSRDAETMPAVLRTSKDVDWKGEYGYVLADLRTLGIVTAVLVVGIIVVGMFL